MSIVMAGMDGKRHLRHGGSQHGAAPRTREHGHASFHSAEFELLRDTATTAPLPKPYFIVGGCVRNIQTLPAVSSGKRGCGRLARSKPNVTRTITIPHDAHLDYLWERLPNECETCMKHHPYIEPVRRVLRLSDWFDDVFGELWNKLDITLYNSLVEREDLPWLEEVPDELVPFKERLHTDRAALIERWATEITGPAAKIDMLAYLFGYRNPRRRGRLIAFHPETQGETVEREARNATALGKAKAALESGQWTLIVQRDRPRRWRLLTRQYWSAARSLDATLTAVILPAALVEYWLAEHQERSDEPLSFTVAGPVPDVLTSDNFCDAFLRCLPPFLFRSFGPKIHPQQQSLDLRPFFDHAVEGKLPEPAEPPVEHHVYSRAVLEDARGILADLLSDLDLNIADWYSCEPDEDEELDTEKLAERERARDEIEELFGELSDFVRVLPLDDPLIAESETYLRPIWDDEDGRIGGVCLYPYGSAYCFLERRVPERGKFRWYLRELMDALAMDWRAWQDLCAFYRADARWPLPKGQVWLLGDKPVGGDNAVPYSRSH
jgi:hypothetical protein